MWIKINQRIVDSTLIRHISGIQEASPERFHADKRAKDEYHRSLEITPLSWLQKFELVMGCIGLMVICWGLVELLLKLVR